MTQTTTPASPPSQLASVVRLWWPLAASWMLMAIELPILTMFVARMADPKIHLAAYGSVVFPLSLFIEAPIIMLLAASAALCGTRSSYDLVRREMMLLGAVLTVIHGLVAFTPLYDVVVVGLLGAPAAIVEPARWGMMIMLPWTWAIAYRRFQQGVLIRFDHSGAVGTGTLVRLVANIGTAASLFFFAGGGVAGVVLAATGTAVGVLAEAGYAHLRVQSLLRDEMPDHEEAEPLTRRGFYSFYVPLALTPLVTLGVQPIAAAAMARMPGALLSLAAWAPTSSIMFFLRSSGMAFNEVVVTLAGRDGFVFALRRFATILSLSLVGVVVLVSATPLSTLWFEVISGLEPPLPSLAALGLCVGVLLPGTAVFQSFCAGILVQQRRTRAVTEAVVVYGAGSVVFLIVGVWLDAMNGLITAILALSAAAVLQTIWLRIRCHGPLRSLRGIDATPAEN